MKAKHIKMRFQQCLAMAEVSPCPRAKFGALLINPETNLVIMEGYNGGLRGAKGPWCGGHVCKRDGYKRKLFKYNEETGELFYGDHNFEGTRWHCQSVPELVEPFIQELMEEEPGVPSGTHHEVGCFHAEQNLIINCAIEGKSTKGAWLIISGEPCGGCSRMIAQAQIARVLILGGGYSGPNGLEYLEENIQGVHVFNPPFDEDIDSFLEYLEGCKKPSWP